MIQKIILLLCFLFFQYELWFGFQGIDRWLENKREYEKQYRINEKIDSKIKSLEVDLEQSESEVWQEHHGREKWGLIGENETLVLFR